MKRLDLSGKTFENCQVIDYAGVNIHGKTQWNCICNCGNQFISLGSELKSGHTKSCGCYSRSGTFTTTHGYRKLKNGKQHPLYSLWVNMRERCHNPNNPKYIDYGGRGISVHPAWRGSFEVFVSELFALIGERPENVNGYKRYWSIDRIDNNGNYEPNNIKWSTPIEQKYNQRPRRWWKKPVGEGN